MSRELLLKYASKSQRCREKCLSLSHWCDLHGNNFGFQEVFDCLYDYTGGDVESLTKAIEQLTTKSKVQGRSSVVWGDAVAKMRLARGEDGRLTVRGHDGNFAPDGIGQHQARTPGMTRDDGHGSAMIIPGGHVVRISESQANGLSGSMKLTEYKFYNNVQRFLSDLLKDPVGAKVPFLLQANNITRNHLLYHLGSNGIIRRSRKISDKDSQGNPKTAKMVIRYSVPKKDFARKMKRLFIDLVARNVPGKTGKPMDECDCGGSIGGEPSGATSADASGQYSQPLFGIQRRKMPNGLEETTAAANVGNYEYVVPFGSDDETTDRTPGFSAERQDEGLEGIVDEVIGSVLDEDKVGGKSYIIQ